MKFRKSKSVRGFALWFCCLYSNVFACGEYNEAPCGAPVGYGCSSGLIANSRYSGRCMIDGMDSWPKYPIRGNSKKDDKNLMLDMDSKNLDETIIVDKATTFNNGRYIYVLRVVDGKLILRSYDRNTEIDMQFYVPGQNWGFKLDYAAYRNNRNYILTTNDVAKTAGCDPSLHQSSGSKCQYQHVRHSQLNGTTPKDSISGYDNSNAWDPVYCAGELRVHNNKIDRINTGSGHFKPEPECTQKVLQVLLALGLIDQLSLDIELHNGSYFDPATGNFANFANDANPIFSCKEYPDDKFLEHKKSVCVSGKTKKNSGGLICSSSGQKGYWVPAVCDKKNLIGSRDEL